MTEPRAGDEAEGERVMRRGRTLLVGILRQKGRERHDEEGEAVPCWGCFGGGGRRVEKPRTGDAEAEREGKGDELEKSLVRDAGAEEGGGGGG